MQRRVHCSTSRRLRQLQWHCQRRRHSQTARCCHYRCHRPPRLQPPIPRMRPRSVRQRPRVAAACCFLLLLLLLEPRWLALRQQWQRPSSLLQRPSRSCRRLFRRTRCVCFLRVLSLLPCTARCTGVTVLPPSSRPTQRTTRQQHEWRQVSDLCAYHQLSVKLLCLNVSWLLRCACLKSCRRRLGLLPLCASAAKRQSPEPTHTQEEGKRRRRRRYVSRTEHNSSVAAGIAWAPPPLQLRAAVSSPPCIWG
jgi:hypothetical protein